jgi:hypothetical protein
MLLFGALFSLFSRPLSGKSIFADIYLWHGLIFTTIFNSAVIYAALYYPDWMWMYFLEDATNTPAELVYLFVFLYYMPYLLGFYLGRDFKRISLSATYFFILALGLTEAWIIRLLFDRYSVIGTNSEFQMGQAVSLFGPDNPIGLIMNASVGVMCVYFILVLFLFRHQRNRLKRL